MEKRLSKNRMPYQQVKYLKHVGKLIDNKVTICIRDGIVCLHIADFEFVAFEPALRFLQEQSRNIVHASQDLEVIS